MGAGAGSVSSVFGSAPPSAGCLCMFCSHALAPGAGKPGRHGTEFVACATTANSNHQRYYTLCAVKAGMRVRSPGTMKCVRKWVRRSHLGALLRAPALLLRAALVALVRRAP